MFAAPSFAARAILADDNAKPNAGTAIAGLATLPQSQHPVDEFIPDRSRPRRRNGRGRGRRRAIARRNHHPCPIRALHVAGIMIVTIPARAGLALGGYRRTGGTADNGPDSGAAPATDRPADDGPRRAAEDGATDGILCRGILHRHGTGNSEKGCSCERPIHHWLPTRFKHVLQPVAAKW